MADDQVRRSGEPQDPTSRQFGDRCDRPWALRRARPESRPRGHSRSLVCDQAGAPPARVQGARLRRPGDRAGCAACWRHQAARS